MSVKYFKQNHLFETTRLENFLALVIKYNEKTEEYIQCLSYHIQQTVHHDNSLSLLNITFYLFDIIFNDIYVH